MEPEESEWLRADISEHLARELHDAVAGHLQAMLVDMELLRRRGEAPVEIETFQAETRQALGRLRELLYQLRKRPKTRAAISEQIERRVGAALVAQQGRMRRSGQMHV